MGGQTEFIDNPRPAVDYSYDVVQIAGAEVVLGPPVKCFQFRSKEIGSRDQSNFVVAYSELLRILPGGTVPAVTEAKDGWIDRHNIENQIADSPTANGITLRAGFAEAEISQLLLQKCELRVGGCFDDHIHVECWTDLRRTWLGDKQAGDAAANKNDLPEQGC